MTAATVSAGRRRTAHGRGKSRVGKRTRQLLVFAHIAVSVGWLGAGAANVVLACTALSSDAAPIRRACYALIDQIDFALVIPLAFGALGSGLLLSVLTAWGIARYWWVLAKLVLTVVVIGYSTFGVGVWVEQSIAATAAGTATSPVAGVLCWGAAANIAAFLFMTWASVAKPWGRTRWARPGRG